LVILNGRHAQDITEKEYVQILKAAYVALPQFCIQQMFAKLSLLFLYYRLFYVNPVFVRWLYAIGGIQIAWTIATYLLHWFSCRPVKKYWYAATPGWCINEKEFLAAGETPNCLVDFALVGLAIWTVHSLKMRTSIKIKLSFIFMLGGLAGILGFVKIGQGFAPPSNPDVEILDPIWALIQMTASVVCCCAPIYQPLFPERGFFTRMRSYGSHIFSKTTRSGRSGVHSPSDGTGASDSEALKQSAQWVQLDEYSLRNKSLSHEHGPDMMESREKISPV